MITHVLIKLYPTGRGYNGILDIPGSFALSFPSMAKLELGTTAQNAVVFNVIPGSLVFGCVNAFYT